MKVVFLLAQSSTIVSTDLHELCQDQVDALRKLGVPAASMASSLSNDEMTEVKKQIKEGTLKLLYVAPERFALSRNSCGCPRLRSTKM